MSLREIIKDLCTKNNVSLNKVETDLGFAKGYISKLDKSAPNSAKLQKIAEYFNVSLDYLMTGKESETGSNLEVKDKTERELLLLCRSMEGVPEKDKEELVNTFKSTIDIYLKAKGLK